MRQSIVIASIFSLVAAHENLQGERGRPIQHFSHDYASMSTVFVEPTPAVDQRLHAFDKRDVPEVLEQETFEPDVNPDSVGSLSVAPSQPVPVGARDAGISWAHPTAHPETPKARPPNHPAPVDARDVGVSSFHPAAHPATPSTPKAAPEHPHAPRSEDSTQQPGEDIHDRAVPMQSSPHGPAGPIEPLPLHPAPIGPSPGGPPAPSRPLPVQHPAGAGVANEERAIEPVLDTLPGQRIGWQAPAPGSGPPSTNKDPHHEREAEPATPNPVANLVALHASFTSAGGAKITGTTGNVNYNTGPVQYDGGYVDKRVADGAEPESVDARDMILPPHGPMICKSGTTKSEGPHGPVCVPSGPAPSTTYN